MKTYFIVEHNNRSGKYWWAHYSGIFSIFGRYSYQNTVSSTCSYRSADRCEEKLRRHIYKPKVVRVVKF